jgi:hypothetical protein
MAYVAAKLLLPGDAAMALLNLAVKATLDLVRDPRRGGAVRELLRGARAGIRRREPVRQSVSRLYRHNFREFTSPLPYLCHPVALWRAGGEPGGLKRYLESRHRAFYRKRPSMYPTETASLLI